MPSSTALRLATPSERMDLTAYGVAVTTRDITVRTGAVILMVSNAVLVGDSIRLPSGVDPWREAAALPLGRNEKVFMQIGRDAAFGPNTHAYDNLHDPKSAAYFIRPSG